MIQKHVCLRRNPEFPQKRFLLLLLFFLFPCLWVVFPHVVCLFGCLFETWYYYIVLVGPELMTWTKLTLSPPFKCWDYWNEPPCTSPKDVNYRNSCRVNEYTEENLMLWFWFGVGVAEIMVPKSFMTYLLYPKPRLFFSNHQYFIHQTLPHRDTFPVPPQH